MTERRTPTRVCERFKPHFLMTMAQIGFTILYFISEAAFSHGQNPFVYVTYRHIVGSIVMFPFAYFLERKERPKLTWPLFIEIFVLSLLGVGLSMNLYFASLKYTSPTFLASAVNSIASLTFVIAVMLGMEKLDIWSVRGVAKIVGTIVSLAGVLTMSTYKGEKIRNLGHGLLLIHGGSIHEEWIKGSVLTMASCLAFSSWYIMQAYTLRRYPAQLSLTTWMSFIGAAQSSILALILERRPEAWAIKFDIGLWSIIYGGVVISGIVVYIQLWCMEKRGPVFVTMFNPLATIMVAFLAYFVLGENLYIGSVIGSVAVIIGLYMVLWGKDKDEEVGFKSNEHFIGDKEVIDHHPFGGPRENGISNHIHGEC